MINRARKLPIYFFDFIGIRVFSMYMQIHEQNKFKFETPLVMPFDYEQDFTPVYLGPELEMDQSPISKKRFFRQLLDISKDMYELRLSGRSVNLSIKKVEQNLDKFEKRISDYERTVKGLSSSVDPLVIQVSELRAQGIKINELGHSLKANKILIGILLLTNLILGILVVYPLITRVN